MRTRIASLSAVPQDRGARRAKASRLDNPRAIQRTNARMIAKSKSSLIAVLYS
jgi:hypothetical protein